MTPFECVLGITVGGGALFLAGFMGKLLFKKEAMGVGDVLLMAMIGSLWGWEIALVSFFLACFLGSIFGIGLLAFRLLREDHMIQFGPFLAVSTWIVVLTFDKVSGWFMALVGNG